MSSAPVSELQERWLALCQSLDASWSSLLDVGGALHNVRQLGLRSSHFHSEVTLQEFIENRAQSRKPDREKDSLLDSEQRWVKFWCDTLEEAQRDLYQAEVALRKEVDTIPIELLSLLNALRRRPWRAHLQRFYLDQLRVLPQLELPFDMAFVNEEGLPASHRTASMPLPLQKLLSRSEEVPPFIQWQLLIRRGRHYAADLYAIRSEVGGKLPDGPIPPNRWRQNGKPTETGMTPLVWKLVAYLWNQEERISLITECAGPVFGDANDAVDKVRIGSHRSGANKFFYSNDIPWEVSMKGDYIFLHRRGAPEQRI